MSGKVINLKTMEKDMKTETKSKASTIVECNLPRYRQLMDLMLAETVKGSPLLNLTDKTSIAVVISKIAYGAILCEQDPNGSGEGA